MAGRHRIPKKDLEFMAKDIGPELLPFLAPEDLIKHLSSEDRLRGLSPVDVLKHLLADAQQRPLNAEEKRLLKQLLESQEEKK